MIDPVTRKEYFLAKLEGQDVTPPEPVTREEIFMAAACGEEIETPEPVTRIEKLLDNLCDGEHEITPVTRIEHFIAQANGDDEETVLTPVTREEQFWSDIEVYHDVEKTASGAIVHIRDALAGPAQNVTIAIEPVQAGTGDPSPDNVRPITGWTGANVYRTGKNLWDEHWEGGSIRTGQGSNVADSNKVRSVNYIPVLPGVSYYFYAPSGGTAYLYYADKSYYTIGVLNRNAAYTIPPDIYYVRFTLGNSSAPVTSITAGTVSFNYPSTDHDYHAYAGTTIPITFPTPPGTVYGGTLDVTTGVLTVDRKKVTGTWGASEGTNLGSVTRKSISLGEYVKAESQGFIPTSSVAKWTRNYMSDTVHFYTDGTQLLLFLPNDTPADTAFEVVYWPATPQTYQLTPTEVQLLAGENNIWADTGDTTLTYLADGRASDTEALNILLGGRYHNSGAADEATDAEALEILLGGTK